MFLQKYELVLYQKDYINISTFQKILIVSKEITDINSHIHDVLDDSTHF